MKVREGLTRRSDMYNTAEACLYIGVRYAALARYIKQGRLVVIKGVGNTLNFMKADLDAFIESRRQDNTPRRQARQAEGARRPTASLPKAGDKRGVDDYLGISSLTR